MCLASFPWGGADPRWDRSIGEVSAEGWFSAPTMHLPLWLDGVLLESWKAAWSVLGLHSLPSCSDSSGLLWAQWG